MGPEPSPDYDDILEQIGLIIQKNQLLQLR